MRAFPDGWFRVAASTEVRPCAVRTVRAFGRELVLFRTRGGALTVADPYCPHLGAHLGRGGRVEGEALRCPFHGLRFAADGRCLDGSRGRLGVWPAREWQGQIWVFHGGSPSWELPNLPDEYGDPKWISLRLRGHVQDVAENGVDLGHFGAVHGYANLKDPQLSVDGVTLRSKFGFERDNPLWARLGRIGAVFDTEIWGLGCSVTRLSVSRFGVRFRLLLLATQIEEEELEFTIGVSAPRGVPSALAALLLRPIKNDVLQDREIWAHKRYLERPALTPNDAPLAAFRKYARQFYSNLDQ